MLKTMPLLLAALFFQGGAPEPARLRKGDLERMPIRAQSAGLVVLDVTVDARGLVSGVKMIKDVAPWGSLMDETVRAWEFDPAREGGQSVESHLLVAGLFRPAMLLFPAPPGMRPPDVEPPQSMPYPTSVVVPPYPPNALADRVVLVEADLSDTGTVTTARVISPSSPFDDSAASSIRQWKFRPARRNGREVPARAYFVCGFRWPTTR